LGKGGVTDIVELDLNEDELTQLREAADAIRAKCEELASRRN
jgi:malate/lactate dehydrogenase